MPRHRDPVHGCCHVTFIYGLCEPDRGNVRYVGKSDSPHKRLKKHVMDARSHLIRNRRLEWIWSLLLKGMKPKLILLAIVPYDDWRSAERKWIQRFAGATDDMLNSEWDIKRR